MANKKDPKWVSLRVPHEHAELIAQASGLDGFPLSTWIIEQSAAVAADRLGVPHLPTLRPSARPPSNPPPSEVQETIEKVEALLAKLRTSESGTRPAITRAEYSLTRSLTPAQLNRAVRAGGNTK